MSRPVFETVKASSRREAYKSSSPFKKNGKILKLYHILLGKYTIHVSKIAQHIQGAAGKHFGPRTNMILSELITCLRDGTNVTIS